MTWTGRRGLGGRKCVRFTWHLSANLPGFLGEEAGRFYYLHTDYVLSSPWGFAWFSETSFKGQAWRPTRSGLGVVDDLKATSSPSVSFLLCPSHLYVNKTAPGARGLAHSRKGLKCVGSHEGEEIPQRQVKRVMDKRAGTKTARHSFPPTVDADAGRRRVPERGAASRGAGNAQPRL